MTNPMIEKAKLALQREHSFGDPATVWDRMTRAVLLAIRVPDEATAEALENVSGVFGLVAWQAAIDSILKETP